VTASCVAPTIKAIPQPPTNFTNTCSSNGYTYMSWDSVTGATGYDIRVKIPAAEKCPSDWNTYTETDGTHNCYVDNYDGLSCGGTASLPMSCFKTISGITSYTAWVHASNASGMSGESARVTASCPAATPITTSIPSAPNDLTATCPSPGTWAYLSWTPVTSATSYNVNVYGGTAACPTSWSTYTYADGTKDCYVTNYNGLSCGGTATNPKSCIARTPGVSYSAWILANNANGSSAISNIPPFKCTAAETTPAPAPTASFTGNGIANDVYINVGDTIKYVWSGAGGTAKATYSIDAGGACSDTSTTPTPWTTGNNLSGNYSIVAATCTGGHTYTYTYTVTGTDGTTAVATLKVHIKAASAAPTAAITANGSTNLTVNVGDTIGYAWSGTNGASAKATYAIDSTACGDSTTTAAPWGYGNTLSGSYYVVAASCTAGHTYTYTYTVTGTDGTTATATVKVYVNLTTIPPPVPSISASCSTDGTQVTLSWPSVTTATSYGPRVDSVTSCPSGWTLYNGTLCFQDGVSGTSITFPVTPGTSHSAWVHPINSAGENYANFPTTFFTCNAKTATPAAPPAPVVTVTNNFTGLPAPTGATASCPSPGTSALFSWNPISGATGYEVAVYVGAATCPPISQGWSTYTNPDGTHNCYIDNYSGLYCGGTSSSPKSCFTTIPGGAYTTWISGMDANGVSHNNAAINFSCALSAASDPYANLASILTALASILGKMQTGQ